MRYPERRQHIRILTLKNFAKFLGIVAVFFAGLSIEYINRDTRDDYGRLVRKEIPRNDDVRPQPPQVVTEGPVVADQTAADPLLLAPAARQQEFLSTTAVTPVVPAEPPQGTIVIRRAHEAPKQQPILAGGIFKQ
jgi:hypothetical protein